MNFWTALVIIVAIIFSWSLVYNIFDMKHKEKMAFIALEGFKAENKKDKETKKEKTKKDESK